MPEPITIDEITKDDFIAYEEVRRGGQWNMFSPQAREATGLERDVYSGIINRYSELMRKWPDVRQ